MSSFSLKYIDAHGHINFKDYDTDRDMVLAKTRELGVGVVTVGTDLESSKECVELAHNNENVWAIIGTHPVDAVQFETEEFQKLINDSRVIGVGECGLDYFHCTPEQVVIQREIFKKHIELANSAGKSLMLHVRNKKGGDGAESAYIEALSILKEHAKVPFNFHFFAGNKDELEKIIDMGGYVSFTGVITFTKDYDELISLVPNDRILSETDCPFVAPVPYRGKRNEPQYVIEVVKRMAEIKKLAVDEMSRQLLANARSFFKIDF